jgi:predicted restriction endonuclease
VKRRAAGKCELCGKLGFKCSDGTRYLECHHIIALAYEGADRMTNVIALCPTDHREAHFGACWAELEKEMMRIVMILEGNAATVPSKMCRLNARRAFGSTKLSLGRVFALKSA